MSSFQRPSLSPVERDRFLVQTIRSLLACIKQLTHLPPEIEDERRRKGIEEFSQAIGREQELPPLQSAFLRCRGGILAHNQLEKHYLKNRDNELREMISVLLRTFAIYSEGSQGNLSELERCTDQLQAATRLDDLAALRKVVSDQVEVIQRKLAHQHQQQGLAMAQMREQLSLLNRTLPPETAPPLSDPATGAGNATGLERAIEQRIDEAIMGSKSFALLCWDVDDFSPMLERFGVRAGDGILKTLVKQCLRMVRGGDYIGRTGRDRFVIVLEDVDSLKAMGRAQEILRVISRLDIMLSGPRHSHRVRATLSIGVVLFRPGDSHSDLLARADATMLAAKSAGKNRVMLETAKARA